VVLVADKLEAVEQADIVSTLLIQFKVKILIK
jgi:hypothetical protein